MRFGRAGMLVAVVLLLITSVKAGEPVRVLDRQGSGLTLGFSALEAEEIRSGAGEWVGLRLPGFVSIMPGSLGVYIPVTSYLVGIPLGSKAICDVIDPTYYDISYYETQDVIAKLGSAAEDLPERPVEITVTGYLRDQLVAGIRVAPVVYDRAAGVLRVFDSFEARVTFRGGEGSDYLSGRPGTPAATGEELFYRRALLNYDQARAWRKHPGLQARQGDYFSDSPDWLKIRIDTTGIYCITGEDLEEVGIQAGTIDTDGLRLYSGGGLPLVESLAEQNPAWMKMAAIRVTDDGDGKFGAADSIVFYALGMYDWANLYDAGLGIEGHYGSFFSDQNFYWLTWGGTFTEPAKRMEVVEALDCAVCGDCYQPESFLDRVHLEEDWRYEFSIRGDDGWYWRILNLDNTATFSAPTPNPDISREAMVKMRLGDDHSRDVCTYLIDKPYYNRGLLRLNGQVVKDTTWKSSDTALRVLDIYGKGAVTASETQSVGIYLPTTLPDSLEGHPVCNTKPSLAWFEVYYWRRFIADGRQLYFVSPDSTCTAKYEVSGFDTGSLLALDVTDQFDVKEIVGFGKSTGPEYTVSLCDTIRQSASRRYAIISPEVMMKPAAIARATIDNIRYASGRPYCLITHEDLEDAGRLLAQFHDGEMVTVQQIYDEFGWGVPDVTAIRDFLRWRYNRGDLEHVLLLGDATWDYKGYLTGETFTNYVPSYERRYRVGAGDPYNTDDWLVYLEPASAGGTGPDSTAYFPTVAIARLPAISPETADFLVDQAIDYVSDPEIGIWQNTIIMVADDERQGSKCDGIEKGRHVLDMEAISDDAYPAVFDRVKIYLMEYPRESTGLKPGSKEDLLVSMNRGALMTNFVGHGDPRRWADEEVFNNTSVELVAAGRRQSLLVASSCNVSKFDDPTYASVAERLLLRTEGGTIGSLASTHLCQALPNRRLHESFVDLLFDSGAPYPTIPIGDAAQGGKALTVAVTTGWQFNSEMYALLGDTGLELAVPELEVRFENPTPDTLQRKGQYGFSARVYDEAGPVEGFEGKARIFARESDDTSGYVSDICVESSDVPKHYAYDLPGAVIFRGKSTVRGGGLDFHFLVTSGAREGINANVRCFVTDGIAAGVGVLDSMVISGESIVEDVDGPEVGIAIDGLEISDGDTVVVGQVMEIIMSDASGVAVKGKSEAVSTVSVAVDGLDRTDLGDSVYAAGDDFRQSRVSYEVPQLAAGSHSFGVTAFDNIGNSTTQEYNLVVGQQGTGAGNVVYVYPNPFSDRCYIIWEYENDIYVEVEVAIYTLAGRKIWSGSTAGRGSQLMVDWDGRDLAGDEVANGTYLAVVEARGPSEAGFETKDTIVIALYR